jgi:protoheme IX farnesyltransferase
VSRISKPVQAELSISAASLVKYHLQAAKVPLCLLVSFSALFGFSLSSQRIGLHGVLLGVSVFLLACGGASLNSFQEHRWDRLMQRTRRRPVAAGLLGPEQARKQGQILAGAGLCLLLLGFASPAPVLAGIVALVLYNLVYTPLKYRSIWAIIPGAICGAIPPYIGWLAGGGTLLSPIIGCVFVLLVIWQMPHFWLVVLANRRDYHESVLPSLAQLMPEQSLRLVSIVWIMALVSVLHTLIVLLNGLPAGIRLMISLVSLVVLGFFGLQLGISKRPDYRRLFIVLNSFMLLVMALFTVGAIVSS